jgi:hypothetical protein
MTRKPEKPFNSRTYQGQIERELIVGGLLVGLIVGGVLIEAIWGSTVLVGALGVFGLFLGLIFAVWLVLKILEFAARD